jgi:hypothetical protein
VSWAKQDCSYDGFIQKRLSWREERFQRSRHKVEKALGTPSLARDLVTRSDQIGPGTASPSQLVIYS